MAIFAAFCASDKGPLNKLFLIQESRLAYCFLMTCSVWCILVVGAVDDHFCKSLGPAWHSENDHIEQPDSVDDHFARALGGDTWLRIKADHERSTSVPPYSALRYYPT